MVTTNTLDKEKNMKQGQNIEKHESNIPNNLLKGEQVAEILQISRSFAYTLMKRGEIPTVQLMWAGRL